jgi:zinc transport system substrate-binding protein
MRSQQRSRRLPWVLLVFSGLAVVAVAFGGCLKSPDDWEGKGGPPRVLVSVPPLYSFVKSVGGDHVGVICLCTVTGPHHYEGDAKDHRLLAKTDLFFTNGLGLDDKFAKPLAEGKTKEPGFLVPLGDRLPKEMVKEDEDHKGEPDPHVWLGIPQAKKMVETIRNELKRVDAAHAADYDANAERYHKTLDDLHDYGKKAFADKKDKRFISFHESLNYFADSFGLEIADVIEVNPGDPPTATQTEKLVKKIQEENIHVIAVEPQYPNSNAARVLLDELKGKGFKDIELVEIDPLETAEPQDLSADLYERKLRENLDNLAKHLK